MKKKMKSGRRERDKRKPKGRKKRRDQCLLLFTHVAVSLTLSSSSCTRTLLLQPAGPAAAGEAQGSRWRPCLTQTQTQKLTKSNSEGKKTLSFIIERSWVRFCHKNSVLPPKTDSILLFLFQYCLYFCRFIKKTHCYTLQQQIHSCQLTSAWSWGTFFIHRFTAVSRPARWASVNTSRRWCIQTYSWCVKTGCKKKKKKNSCSPYLHSGRRVREFREHWPLAQYSFVSHV